MTHVSRTNLAALSTARKKDRLLIADAIQRTCGVHGVKVIREDEAGSIVLAMDVHGQAWCRVEIGGNRDDNVFILPWNSADDRRLSQVVFDGRVNLAHGLKATIVCNGAQALRQHLIGIFLSASEGRLFQPETQAEQGAVTTLTCDNIDGNIPGEGALYRVPVTVDVTMTALVLARGADQKAAIEEARKFAADGGARFSVDEGNYRSLADHYVGDPTDVVEVADPIEIEKLGIGSVIVSLRGEMSTVDDDLEVETGPNAHGYIATVLPRQDSCYSVVFPATGVWVLLSKAELQSGDYRLAGQLSVGDIVGTQKHDDAESTVLRWNGRDAVDSGEAVVNLESSDIVSRAFEWLKLDADGSPLQDPIDAENDAHARNVERHGR